MNEYTERTRWDDGPAIGSGFGRLDMSSVGPTWDLRNDNDRWRGKGQKQSAAGDFLN